MLLLGIFGSEPRAGIKNICFKVEIIIKKKLTAQIKHERMFYSDCMMGHKLGHAYRIVWMDEASVILYPTRRSANGRIGEETLTVRNNLRPPHNIGVQLCFLLAVNGACGLVHAECLYDKTMVGTAEEQLVSYKIIWLSLFFQGNKGSLSYDLLYSINPFSGLRCASLIAPLIVLSHIPKSL